MKDCCRLECRNLSKHFGGVRAVTDFGTTFDTGEIVGLIGPNGAGKSTVIDLLSGRIRPDSGAVYVDEMDITGWSTYSRARLGMMRSFQMNSEFSRLTVLENVMIASQKHPGERLGNALFRRRKWRAYEATELESALGLLREFGLAGMENEYAGNLSGGQKRLLELARTVMARPRILLLDEPTVGVSATLRPTFVEHIRVLASKGVACLLVEHSLEVVSELCRRVIVMAAGSVLAEGPFDSVTKDKRVIDAYLN